MMAAGAGYVVAGVIVESGRLDSTDRMVWSSVIAVPILVAGLIVAVIVRARSLAAGSGVLIDIGDRLTVTRQQGHAVVLSAAWPDVAVTPYSLLSLRAGEGSALSAPIVELRSGRRAITVGCVDGSVKWRSARSNRFTFDWACDGAGFRKLSERVGLSGELTGPGRISRLFLKV